MMLEYMYFDFSPFGNSYKVISNLSDFLNYMDRIDGFENFKDTRHGKICSDIANELAYLHARDTAHRDLKPKNILVCNSHYCHIDEDEQQWAVFEKTPIICKPADFAESKSCQIQSARKWGKLKLNKQVSDFPVSFWIITVLSHDHE